MPARQQIQQHPHHQPTIKKEKQVIRYRARVTLGEKIIAGFLAVVLFGLLSLMVHNYSTIYGLNLSIQSVQTEINASTLHNEGLRTQVAELSAPEHVMQQAIEMGMRPAEEHSE